jgi:hypothetical protein
MLGLMHKTEVTRGVHAEFGCWLRRLSLAMAVVVLLTELPERSTARANEELCAPPLPPEEATGVPPFAVSMPNDRCNRIRDAYLPTIADEAPDDILPLIVAGWFGRADGTFAVDECVVQVIEMYAGQTAFTLCLRAATFWAGAANQVGASNSGAPTLAPPTAETAESSSAEPESSAPAQTGTGQGFTFEYYVYVLEGIGFYIGDQDEVATKRSCDYTGGGRCPPASAPAKVLGTYSGPFPNVAAAKADLTTKLTCRQGYWGAQGQWGSGGSGLAAGGWHWLQNNVRTSDCKSVEQR